MLSSVLFLSSDLHHNHILNIIIFFSAVILNLFGVIESFENLMDSTKPLGRGLQHSTISFSILWATS